MAFQGHDNLQAVDWYVDFLSCNLKQTHGGSLSPNIFTSGQMKELNPSHNFEVALGL